MKEVSLGPVWNPDGTPTEVTKAMLGDTGRLCEEPSHCARAETARDCAFNHVWIDGHAIRTPYHRKGK